MIAGAIAISQAVTAITKMLKRAPAVESLALKYAKEIKLMFAAFSMSSIEISMPIR